MANTKSAKKAIRQTKRRTARNKIIRSNVKNAIKNEKDLSKIQSIIDKAAKRNIIHKNKAAKLKAKIPKEVKVKKPV